MKKLTVGGKGKQRPDEQRPAVPTKKPAKK